MKSLLECIHQSVYRDNIFEAVRKTTTARKATTKKASMVVDASSEKWMNKYAIISAGDYKISSAGLNIRKAITPFIQPDAPSLTDGKFKWGKMAGDFSVQSRYIVDLIDSPVSVKGCYTVSGCENLISLNGACEAYSWNITGCKKLKSLEGINVAMDGMLVVEKCDGIKSLSGLEGFQVKNVSLRECRNLSDVSALADMDEDYSLEIRNCPKVQLASVGSKHLNVLSVFGVSKGPELNAVVKASPNLREIRADYVTIYDTLRGGWVK